MKLITKKQAAYLALVAGYTLEYLLGGLYHRNSLVSSGEIMLLPNGAKLAVIWVGSVRRFAVAGYNYDGSDVAEILTELEHVS